VVDDSVHHDIVSEESDDLHRGAALDTGQGIHLVDLADHCCPAPARDPRAFLLDDQELRLPFLCFPALSPVGIGVEAGVTNCDLALSRDKSGRIMYFPTRSASFLV